ncbi:hypothetical protein ACFV5N_05590 [Streptomyces sp. NPDC059853]|uniref:imine reductase family protein n=1 Tax=Streptomyces sp. NPDC059853 TaxID=3346973 RepID=UPI00364AD370
MTGRPDTVTVLGPGGWAPPSPAPSWAPPRGLDTRALDAVRARTDRAVAKGHGGDGFARVVELLKR